MGAQLFAIFLIGLTILILRLFPPKNLLNDSVAIAEIVFSSILLFSFFLTWFSWGTIFSLSLSANGYEIPIKIKQWLQTEDFVSNSDKTALYVSYFVYLIPIFSVATIITSSLRQNKTANVTARFASLIPFFCFLILLIFFISGRSSESDSPLQYIDFGFYLMVLSGVGLWVSALRTSKLANTSVFLYNEPNKSTVIEIDKTILLSQLEKLHSLKEKGVLTEDIYEQERQVILNQLQRPSLNESIEQSITTEEENTSTIEEYSPEYEELFGKETWFKKNKTWLITSIVVGILAVGSYFLYEASKTNEEKIIGLWALHISDVNVEDPSKDHKDHINSLKERISAYYYKFNEDKSLSYDIWFKGNDTENIETTGKYSIATDGKTLKLIFEDESDNEEYEIVEIGRRQMILKSRQLKLTLNKL